MIGLALPSSLYLGDIVQRAAALKRREEVQKRKEATLTIVTNSEGIMSMYEEKQMQSSDSTGEHAQSGGVTDVTSSVVQDHDPAGQRESVLPQDNREQLILAHYRGDDTMGIVNGVAPGSKSEVMTNGPRDKENIQKSGLTDITYGYEMCGMEETVSCETIGISSSAGLHMLNREIAQGKVDVMHQPFPYLIYLCLVLIVVKIINDF